ncbi:hypothetical protein SAMN02745218_01158 [Desulfofundulus australicus DSM 11792]|uniref:Uncharacterized protein n=1 Tax=Desulfofundulus australicus DSM 11792 TaxID=1121425 RepID=A0A1M4XT55_9FIRM|nr:hypothetical protein [Desulfofundulus australicus]SHE96570.1 hypothetical protein SAMN02745218_01158 [Desulfofundulus australicus DSM 11792]
MFLEKRQSSEILVLEKKNNFPTYAVSVGCFVFVGPLILLLILMYLLFPGIVPVWVVLWIILLPVLFVLGFIFTPSNFRIEADRRSSKIKVTSWNFIRRVAIAEASNPLCFGLVFAFPGIRTPDVWWVVVQTPAGIIRLVMLFEPHAKEMDECLSNFFGVGMGDKEFDELNRRKQMRVSIAILIALVVVLVIGILTGVRTLR